MIFIDFPDDLGCAKLFFAHKRIEVSSGIILFHPFSLKKMPQIGTKLPRNTVISWNFSGFQAAALLLSHLAAGFLISSDAAEQLGGFHSA